MKLVDFETFNKMPAGTVFAPYSPHVLKDRLAIKVDAGKQIDENKYSFNGVMPLEPWNAGDLCFIGEEYPASFEIYDGDSNDYSDEDKILVLDKSDVAKLMGVLMWAYFGCPDLPEELWTL